jgi:hypothetical protein
MNACGRACGSAGEADTLQSFLRLLELHSMKCGESLPRPRIPDGHRSFRDHPPRRSERFEGVHLAHRLNALGAADALRQTQYD